MGKGLKLLVLRSQGTEGVTYPVEQAVRLLKMMEGRKPSRRVYLLPDDSKYTFENGALLKKPKPKNETNGDEVPTTD